MIFVHGKRRTDKYIGYRAEFCPICRKPMAFHVFEVIMENHLYYISLEKGTLAYYRLCCTGCKVDNYLPATCLKVHKDCNDLDSLIDETNPGLKEYWEKER
jgi:hypothetical protein